MRQGYLTPPVLIFLAIISLFVAGTLFLHSLLVKSARTQPALNPTPSASPAPNPDLIGANWKTYTNKAFKFQLMYPDTWFANDCDTTVLLLLDPTNPPVCGGGPLGYIDPIVISIYAPNKTIADFVNDSEAEGIKLTFRNSQPPLPNNAVKYFLEKIRPAPGVDKSVPILVPLKSAVLVIHVNNLQYESTADQILSTFKFVE